MMLILAFLIGLFHTQTPNTGPVQPPETTATATVIETDISAGEKLTLIILESTVAGNDLGD